MSKSYINLIKTYNVQLSKDDIKYLRKLVHFGCDNKEIKNDVIMYAHLLFIDKKLKEVEEKGDKM